jgi:hypothetical protein
MYQGQARFVVAGARLVEKLGVSIALEKQSGAVNTKGVVQIISEQSGELAQIQTPRMAIAIKNVDQPKIGMVVRFLADSSTKTLDYILSDNGVITLFTMS